MRDGRAFVEELEKRCSLKVLNDGIYTVLNGRAKYIAQFRLNIYIYARRITDCVECI